MLARASALLVATVLASPLVVVTPTSAAAQVTIGISVQVAPPVLPVYESPRCPPVIFRYLG
jgi:hypothetical protein